MQPLRIVIPFSGRDAFGGTFEKRSYTIAKWARKFSEPPSFFFRWRLPVADRSEPSEQSERSEQSEQSEHTRYWERQPERPLPTMTRQFEG